MKVAPQVTIRELTPADYPRLCELRNLTVIEPWSVELLLDRDANLPEGMIRHRLAACADDEVIGAAQASHWPSMHEGLFFVSIDVLPEHRRRGTGTKLMEELERVLKDAGATAALANARDDRAEGRAFLEKSGFTFTQHLFDSDLETELFDENVYAARKIDLEDKGVQIVSFSQWGDTEENRRTLYETHNICDADTPGISDWGLMTYEHFELDMFAAPRYDPEGMFIAFYDGKIIGMSMVAPVSEERYGTHFTGTIPEWRGRGLAFVLKGMCVARAKQAGARLVGAQNDSRNAPMLAVNTRLGFKPQFGWTYMRKDLGAEVP